MTNPLRNFCNLSRCLPSSARGRSASGEREGNKHYTLKTACEGVQGSGFHGAPRLVVAVAVSVLLAMAPGEPLVPAHAQTVPKSLAEGGTDAVLKQRKNAWTVGVAGGQRSGTYMTFADELAQVLDDGDNLRVMPIVTYGAASNLDDLLYTAPGRSGNDAGGCLRVLPH